MNTYRVTATNQTTGETFAPIQVEAPSRGLAETRAELDPSMKGRLGGALITYVVEIQTADDWVRVAYQWEIARGVVDAASEYVLDAA